MRTLLITLLLGLLLREAKASVVVAASGGYTDVSNAVISAGFGGTVWVPTNSAIAPGTNHWAGGLNLVGVSLMASNPISILETTNAPYTLFLAASGSTVIVSNFVFDGGINNNGVIGVTGSNICFRITHNVLLNSSSGSGSHVGIQVGDDSGSAALHTFGPWGLIDGNYFQFQNRVPNNFISLFANGSADQWCWSNTMTWGTTNQVVIENNGFWQSGSSGTAAAAEAMGGARFTLRNNSITNIPESIHGFNSGAHCSTAQVEIYNNDFEVPDTSFQLAYIFLIRGGTSVIWSNQCHISGSYVYISSSISYWVECAQSGWQAEFCSKQLQYPQDYPAVQQIGQGVVAPNVISNMPCYVWGNSFPNTPYGILLGANLDSSFIQQGRDVFTNSVKPGYVPLQYPYPWGQAATPPPTPVTTFTGILTH